MGLFEPADGELPRRQIIYNAIRDKPSEEVIPYAALPYDKEVVVGLRESVSKLFESDQGRCLVCIPAVGWKVVHGTAQVEQATRKRKGATRRLGRAVQIIQSADRRDMTAEEQVRADRELIAASTGYRALRGIALKRPSLEDIKRWQDGRRKDR